MDFSKLGSTKKTPAPTDPIKIIETLHSLHGTFNDLWRGQDKALTDWNAARTKHDVLVSLNTGAGKTIVGLLIAQSLVNEGLWIMSSMSAQRSILCGKRRRRPAGSASIIPRA